MDLERFKVELAKVHTNLSVLASECKLVEPGYALSLIIEIKPNTPPKNNSELCRIVTHNQKILETPLEKFFTKQRLEKAGYKVRPYYTLVARLWNNQKTLKTVGDLVAAGKKRTSRRTLWTGEKIMNIVSDILGREGIHFE